MSYNLELVTQKPIKFNNITIIQPSLNYILDEIGMDKYNELLIPYIIDIDDFELNDDIREQYNLFDILITDGNLELLLNSLSVFCNTKNMQLDIEKKRLYIGENYGYLDCNNFKEFANIILKINSKQRPEKEVPPKNMTDKQRDIWEKLQAGRKRQTEKSQIDLADLINTCQLGGNYYISMSDILDWTLYNISRCYQTILGKSSYQDAFAIYCVTGEKDLINNKHWTDLISVEDKKIEQMKI